MDYSYDAADRLTYLNDASFAPAMKQGLAYDALNRLYSVRSCADNDDYRYDADGNLTCNVRSGATSVVHNNGLTAPRIETKIDAPPRVIFARHPCPPSKGYGRTP